MRRRRRSRRGGNRKGMIGISAVVLVLLVSLSVQSNTLKQKNAGYAKQQEQQIDAQEKRTKEIQELEEYMQTDEYVAEVARDKLGLVYGDEILFKPEE